MKLAFSTLGCPEWDFDEILATALRLGYEGVEFRGLLTHIELDQAPEFSAAGIADTRQRLRDAGVQATCLSSSVQILNAVTEESARLQAIATAERYIEMAQQVEAPFVRLFGGNPPDPLPYDEAEARAAELLRALGDFAADRQVTLVVETHDYLIDSARLAHLIHATDHQAVGVLWDIHHPYRIAGESLQTTMDNLRGLVRYTHIKDSRQGAEPEQYTYVALGLGDVPIKESLAMLRDEGYDGFLTLEWEKRWIPDLLPPEIVFDHYAEQMRDWLGEL